MLLEGHSSHIYFYVVFQLPSHSSHALQFADRGLFGSFKSNFLKKVSKFMVQYREVFVTKQTFCRIFTKAYGQSCHDDIVKGFFRVS